MWKSKRVIYRNIVAYHSHESIDCNGTYQANCQAWSPSTSSGVRTETFTWPSNCIGENKKPAANCPLSQCTQQIHSPTASSIQATSTQTVVARRAKKCGTSFVPWCRIEIFCNVKLLKITSDIATRTLPYQLSSLHWIFFITSFDSFHEFHSECPLTLNLFSLCPTSYYFNSEFFYFNFFGTKS